MTEYIYSSRPLDVAEAERIVVKNIASGKWKTDSSHNNNKQHHIFQSKLSAKILWQRLYHNCDFGMHECANECVCVCVLANGNVERECNYADG